MKKQKPHKEAHSSSQKRGDGDWHTNFSSLGMGDFYGTGIRQKLGRVRGGYSPLSNPTQPEKLKVPPKSLA